MVCPWGPGGKAELHAVFTHRDFNETTHHETKGKKKNKIRSKKQNKTKKVLQTIRKDVQERSQEKKVYRNMETDHDVHGMTGQVESH